MLGKHWVIAVIFMSSLSGLMRITGCFHGLLSSPWSINDKVWWQDHPLLLLLSRFSRVWLRATPETAAHQALLSLGFSRQEHWSGLPFPSPMHESEKGKWSRSVVSDSSRPHGLQPTRLLRPWDFPGKSTGAGCHCLLRRPPTRLRQSSFWLWCCYYW